MIPWVNGNDSKWITKKNKYEDNKTTLSNYISGESRYRDYGTLNYLLLSIEKYASWVNRIFIITDNQVPEGISDNPKIELIDHSDFIDDKFLPTFNSNAIELNIHHIEKLSEHFVLFNDDMILNNKVEPDDFFKCGLPVDATVFSPIFPESEFDRIRINNVAEINKHFDKRTVQKKIFTKIFNFKYHKLLINNILVSPYSRFTGFHDSHLPISYTKAEFKEVWNYESELLNETISHKFRKDSEISHWFIRYWRLMKGQFATQKLPFGRFFYLFEDASWEEEIINGKSKVICINDCDDLSNIDKYIQKLTNALDTKLAH